MENIKNMGVFNSIEKNEIATTYVFFFKKTLSTLLLCSPVYLLKHNIYALFGRLKQFFSCFYGTIFDALFCYLVEQPIHAFNVQVKYCLFLHCFDIFVKETKEMCRTWNMALLADLILTCGQHVFFLHLCMCTNHNNLNFLLIN